MHDDRAEITLPAGRSAASGGLLRSRPALWTLLLFYAAYVASGTFSSGLAVLPGFAVIFWPPVGILIATLLLNQRASWPWWIAAGCAAELTANSFLWQNPVHYALIYYSGNALEALTAAYLISRFSSKPFRLETIEQVLSFVFLAAGIAPMVSSTIIAAVDAFRGRHAFTTGWPLVWVGDATGLLISAPLTFVAVQAWRERNNIPPARLLQAGAALLLMLGIAALALVGPVPTIYLSLPVLLWIAARFRLKGTAVALGLLTLLAGSLTVAGMGQFATPSPLEQFNLVRFHVFLAVSAISALFVAALSQQRIAAQAALEAANRDLERRVAERTGDLFESEKRYRAVVESQSEMICRFRPEGTFLFVNDAYAKVMGTTAEKLIGVNFWKFIPESEHAGVREMLDSLSPERPEVQIENRLETPGGTIWTLWMNRALVFDERGRVVEAQSTGVDITARKLAEEKLRASEEQYRTLFESIDEGYCVVEMIHDESGKPADYRFVQINPAFSKNTGLPVDAVGKTARELVPDLEDRWIETYGRVSLTGEPVRFEDNSSAMGRWFDVYALRVGAPEQHRVGILFNDITERKRREENLAFLAEMAEDFARLTDTGEIIATLGAKLGAYLGVEHCLFAEIDEERDEVKVSNAWRSGSHARELVGTYRLSEYVAETFREAARRGETIVSRDTQNDPRVDAAAYAAYNIGAFVSVPFHHGDEWRYLFTVNDSQVRNWRDDEIELIREVTNRLFPRLERARAEAALRESQAEKDRQRRLYDTILSNTPDLTYVFDLDHRFTYANTVLLQMWGKTWDEAIGKTCLELGYEPWHAEMHDREIEQVIATRQPVRGQVPFSGTFGRRIYDYIFVPIIGADGQVEAVAGTTRDVTDQHQAAARDEFRVRLADAIRPLRDADEVKKAAVDLLGERLGVNRAFYAEVRGDVWMAVKGFESGVEPMPDGPYSAEDFGQWIMDAYRRGERIVFRDTQTDERFSAAQREAHAALGIIGAVGVPLVKAGELVAIIAVHTAAPRDWTEEEIAAVEETAERTWDAVERVRAEANLRAAHDTFRLLVERSPFGIYVVDADFRLAQVAAGAQKVFENVRPLIGRDFAEVLRTVWQEPFATDAINIFRRTLQTGETYHSPRTVETRGDISETESYDWRIERITMPDGRYGVVCHFYDLSERLQYEAALRRSEERYRGIVDQTVAGIAETDLTGRFVTVNDQYCRITGYAREELLRGMRMQDITHPDDMGRNVDQFERLAAEGAPFDLEKRYIRKDGSVVWVQNSVSAISDASGRPQTIVAVSIDITERKRAEEALRASEELLSAVMAQLPVGLGVIDRNGKWIRANSMMSELIPRSIPSTSPERSRWRIFSEQGEELPPEEWPGQRALRGETVAGVEALFTGEDGIERWMRVSTAPLLDAAGEIAGATCVVVDIDAVKRAEMRLAEQKRLYQSVTDNATTALFIMDDRQHCVFMNPAAEELTGYTLEETFGKPLHDVVHHKYPDGRDYPLSECPIDQAFPSRNKMRGEEVFVHKDGHFYDVAFSASPLRDMHGQPIGTVIEVQDITERKRAEEAIRESEERFRNMADNAPVMVWVTDASGYCTYLSRSWYEFSGQTEDEGLGFGWLDATHPDDREYAERTFLAANASCEAFRLEYRLRRADGEYRWAIDSARPRFSDTGVFLGYIGSVIDITDRKRMEQALRTQTELLRGITEATPDLIYAKDISGRMIMANKATLDVFGHTEETAIGRLDSELYDPGEAGAIMANDRSVMLSGRSETFEEVITTENGSVTFLTTKTPMRDADGRVVGVVGVSHDITALKRTETALRESETRHRLALEAGGMGTWTMPMDGRRAWADHRTLALFDIPAEEWNGDISMINSRRFPEDIEANSQTVTDADGRTTWRSEFRVRHRDGSVRWLAGVARIEYGTDAAPRLMRGIYFDITERKQAEEELRRHHEILEETVRERTRELAAAISDLEYENRQRRIVEEERQMLLARLVAAQEEERRRIAQDLHDHLGQQLTALNMKLDLAARAAGGSGAAHLSEARAMLRGIDEDVDALAWQLRPAMLDDDGFVPALRRYVEDWSVRYRVPAEFWADDGVDAPGFLSSEAETNLYRITQEALNNIAKYAGASNVEVLLKRRGDAVVLLIQDDGAGFDVAEFGERRSKTMGLVGMRERAGLVGGTFQIESFPGEGTTVYVRVPLAPAGANGSGFLHTAG